MMLKLLNAAANTQSRRGRKEMSLLRRLLCQGRALLREYQLFGYRRCVTDSTHDWRFLKIEFPGRSRGYASSNPATRSAPTPSRSLPELSNSSFSGRFSGNAPRTTSPTSTLQWVGQEVRKIFINNILNRVTTNEKIAKQTAQRLLYGDSRPFFALVGVSMAAGATGMLTQESEYDNLCWEIRESMMKKQRNAVSVLPGGPETGGGAISVNDLKFGNLIRQGCNAAVYAAEWSAKTNSEIASNSDSNTDSPLAVKMLFNYDIESNASSIFRAMVREVVPARNICLSNINELDRGIFHTVRRCPPHDNIIEITHAFVDQIPMLPEGMERYPSALPRRLNDVDGLGRNMSLFLVMKRYDCNLADFLSERKEMNFKTRLCILTQLLEGVAHLERNQIAHRDLKTDNVLVDTREGDEFPRIVLTDFGCCLSDQSNGLHLAFRTYDTERGGNAALMAPEVATAVPGSWKWINYDKSDAWSVGTMAYEIFGSANPFYRNKSSEKPLDSRTYKESELKPIDNNDVPSTIRNLVFSMLKRNPNERISAQEASIICHLYLWAPSLWLSTGKVPDDDEIMQWLVTLTTKALCHGSEEVEYKMIQNFLRKMKFRDVKFGINWIKDH